MIFLENVSTDGVYLNLYAFEPELRTFEFFGHSTAVGIIAGAYQNRLFSNDSTNTTIGGVQYTLIDSLPNLPGSASYIRNLYSINTNQQIDQTGLYLNPIFCVGKTERAVFYAGPSVELLRRRFKTEQSFILNSSDTGIATFVVRVRRVRYLSYYETI